MTKLTRPLADLDRQIVHKHYEPRGANPVPLAQSTEAPTYCLKVNVHWVSHVMGLLMALDQQDAWKGAVNEIEFARNEARKLIASLDVCGDDEPMADCTPIGATIIWWSEDIPEGWLRCDGGIHAIADYPDLAAYLHPLIPNGSTNFAVPNMGYLAPIGVLDNVSGGTYPDIGLGTVIGEKDHTLNISEMPAHDHTINTGLGGGTTAQRVNRDATSNISLGGTAPINDTGGGGSHNNMQPSIAVYYLIKALNCEPEGSTVMSYVTRQNPSNPCLYEYSIDGGSTWLTSFDFNLCFGEMKDDVKDIKDFLYNLDLSNTNIYIDNLINNYDGDVTNIYPEAEYGDDNDPIRNAALCFAIEQYSLYLKELIKELIPKGGDEEGILKLLSGASGAASTFAGALLGFGVAIPGGIFLVGSLALVSAATAIGALALAAQEADVTSEDVDAFSMDDFTCCIYDSMKDQTISESLFQNSFTSCAGSSFGTDELDVLMREMLLIIAQDDSVFVAFVKLLSAAYDAQEDGILFDGCPCSDPMCELQDFSTDGMGDWTIDVGTLVAGQGVRGTGSPTYGAAAVIRDLGMAFEITQIDMDWYCPRNDDAQVYNIQAKLNVGDAWTMLKQDDFQNVGRQVDFWIGSFTARYIRLLAPGSVVAARSGQIFAANVCYQ